MLVRSQTPKIFSNFVKRQLQTLYFYSQKKIEFYLKNNSNFQPLTIATKRFKKN